MSSDTPAAATRAASPRLLRYNRDTLLKLALVTVLMFGFAYALVPLYKTICEALGTNVLARGDVNAAYGAAAVPANTQVDVSRSISIEFDANVRGPWEFHPESRGLKVHPGELAEVVYEFRNPQNRTMTAQAMPSYAPGNAQSYFTKLECFCFQQHTLKPGESKRWPVKFYIDPKLPRDVTTITLSYTFFEVGGRTPPAPAGHQKEGT